MKFKKVELHAFRAYKNKDNGTFHFTLTNDKIANFISIYAPNGFGKTSFYDGVEWAVTKNISRLDVYKDISNAERKFIVKKNGSREKQYILRNKFVDDETEGYVKVWTDKGVFEETIPSISKAGGKDYSFDTKKGINKYFKNVILSQEGIDNFLKADDDKERYKKFISHFGDQKLDTYYNNIEQLEKNNNKSLQEIDKKISAIEKRLNKSINETILQSINSKILELNSTNNEQLNLVDDSFNEIKKGELEIKLSQQKKQLNKQIEYIENNLIVNLPNWIIDSEKYFNDKNELEILRVKINDFNKFANIIHDITIVQREIEKNGLEKEKLEKLKNIFPQYQNIKQQIDNTNKKLKELKDIKLQKEFVLNKQNIDLSRTSKDIKSLNNEKKEISNLLDNIPKIYENIEKINKYKKLKKKLSSLNNTKEAIKNNIFIDLNFDEKYIQHIKKIELLLEEKRSNKKKLDLIKSKKSHYEQYNVEIQKLLSLGVQIIDKEQQDTCPLCNTKHESYDILKDKILNNPLLNTLEKDLLKEEEQIQHQININNKNIEEEKKFIFSELNKEINEVKTTLSTIEYQIKKVYTDKVEQIDSILQPLINKTENKPQDELVRIIKDKQQKLTNQLNILNKNKHDTLEYQKIISNKINDIQSEINAYENKLTILHDKEEYLEILNYLKNFEYIKSDLLEKIQKDINDIAKVIKDKKIELDKLNEQKTNIQNKYSLENLDKIIEKLGLLKNKEFELYTKNILTFESSYEEFFKNKIIDINSVKKDVKSKKIELSKILTNNKKKINLIEVIENNTNNLLKIIENKKLKQQLEIYQKEKNKKKNIATQLNSEKKLVETKINKDVEDFFHEDLINKIYEKIDPHPEYKKVKFECHFENGIGKLNVFVDNNDGTKHISPSLYYSTAQLNVLSLSIFLAKALNTKDDDGDDVNCIFIDDPIQSMDSINILATIDLLRSLVINHNKQIILSTHDENFYYLLQKKIPKNFSKFIELETYGKILNNS